MLSPLPCPVPSRVCAAPWAQPQIVAVAPGPTYFTTGHTTRARGLCWAPCRMVGPSGTQHPTPLHPDSVAASLAFRGIVHVLPSFLDSLS